MQKIAWFIKKLFGIVGTLIAMLLTFAAALVCFSLSWMFQTWSNLTMDELVYHLQSPLEGTNTGMVEEYIQMCVVPSILILIAIIIGFAGLRHRKKYYVFMALVLVIAVAATSVSLYSAGERLDIKDYTKSQGSYSEFIDTYYVNPAETGMEFPEQKRNLIYIFLESMEITYADQKNGGGFDENVIPELTEIAKENEDFSGTDTKLNGAYALTGATWTMGAMFAHTSGLPLNISIDGNNMDTQDSFFPGIITMGDILREEGYSQTLLIGSDATFGGRRLYFTDHGQFDIVDYNYAAENQMIPEGYAVWWGYEDQKLFQFAKNKLTELAAQDSPFNLTMLTVDTHFEDGYVCEQCRNEYEDNPYANVMACSSRQLGEFINWIQQQDFYENTTIVLAGDHPTMDSDFCEDVSDMYDRKTYVTYINSAAEKEVDEPRVYSTFDLFPTTLAAMGVRIEGERLGLGTNLYSSTQTLLERFDVDTVQRELKKKSKLMEKLADLNEDDQELLVRESGAPIADIYVDSYDFRTGIMPVILSNIRNFNGEIQSVMLAVWTEEDQSDLQWIPMEVDENGNYNGRINVPGFGYKVGAYKIHAYAIGEDGTPIILGEATGFVS